MVTLADSRTRALAAFIPPLRLHLSEWIEENTGRERTYLAAFCFVGYFVGSETDLTKIPLIYEIPTA
jgi:hypothetical protein